MDPGNGLYSAVGLLIVRWSYQWDGGSKTDEEVQQFRGLMEHDLQFEVDEVLLVPEDARPQDQLEKAMNEFIDKYDRPHRKHLLIVYYTGHARVSSERPNDLVLCGQNSVGDAGSKPSFEPTASWEQAQRILLENVCSDTLLILDCCSAGSVFTDFHHGSSGRVFEVMVAAPRGILSANAGPYSFTAALIRALRKLRAEGDRPITTWELSQTILKDAEESAWSKVHLSNLHPVLLGESSRHIVLARPLQEIDGPEEA